MVSKFMEKEDRSIAKQKIGKVIYDDE